MPYSNSILVIVYDFPPQVGGGGVMRTVKLLKYLPENNFTPFVLTVKRKDSWMPDQNLLKEIPSTTITRCYDLLSNFKRLDKASEKASLVKKTSTIKKIILALSFFRLYLKNCLIPDQRVGWAIPAIIEGLKIIKNNDIRYIYATSPPHTPLLVGYMLSLITGKKLILDYRDGWTENNLFVSNFIIKNLVNTWLEKIILNRSSLVITTTEQIKLTLKIKTNTQIVTISNGFDPDDFDGLVPLGLSPNKTNFVYLGGFAGSRTSKHFMHALKQLKRNIKNNISFHIIGQSSQEELSLLNSVNDIEINIIDSLPHKEALRYLISADFLILFIYPEEDSNCAIPGKIYEYLAAKRPIIAFCEHTSALAKLLYNQSIADIINPKDHSSISDIISYRAFNKPIGAPYLCDEYNRKYNTCQVAYYISNIK